MSPEQSNDELVARLDAKYDAYVERCNRNAEIRRLHDEGVPWRVIGEMLGVKQPQFIKQPTVEFEPRPRCIAEIVPWTPSGAGTKHQCGHIAKPNSDYCAAHIDATESEHIDG